MLRKITVTTIYILTLLHTSVASARQWVVLNNTPMVSVDVDSIKGEGNTRTFWSEVIENQKPSSNSHIEFERDKYRSVKTLTFVDCAKNKLGIFRMVGYDSNGDVVDDYDVSHLSVPPNLVSTIPDSIGEKELLYVCGLRTSNAGRRHNNPSSSSKPKPNTATASRNPSFPRATCGNPFQSRGTYWPVFIDGGNVSRVRTSLCQDAFATVRANTGVKSVQLGSFTSYDRALSFAKQVGGTVGQATHYINGRAVN